MNNNRGNNRRRGRGNNRQQGGGHGGQQLNRIDSRARGNAPQLLEKYRKLAHDSHLNGDRVTEEYYLQFADHYFRVLADQRQRQEEVRQQRQDRWQDNGDGDRYDGDSAGDYGADADYPASPYNYGERRERDEGATANAAPAPEETATNEDGSGDASGSIYEPTENPFVRENRGPRGTKPRRPRRDSAEDAPSSSQLDLAVLPPAIASRDESSDDAAEDAKPKPKRRTTRRKPSADDSGEALQAAG